MSEPTPEPKDDKTSAAERTKQLTVVGYTAGTSVFFLAILMGTGETWPVAFGTTALAAMVALVCYHMLKKM